jgi:hypothetical protein
MSFDLSSKQDRNKEASAFDPVIIYFHEIGQFPLLKTEDEIFLSQKIEIEKRLQSIQHSWLRKYHRPFKVKDIPLALLGELAQAINIIQDNSGAASLKTLLDMVLAIGSIDELDKRARKQLINMVVNTTGEYKLNFDTRMNLAVDVSLLPYKVWEAISGIIDLELIRDYANGLHTEI